MPAHNNAIQRPHLRKHWAKWVKTWFNQPARKTRRLQKRKDKAARIFPAPLNSLRPIVAKNTVRYTGQPRFGRGFTKDELKQAGINPRFARTIGISVDLRRTNKSVEALQKNANRLKAFVERIVLLPRQANKPKKGSNGVLPDATDVSQVVQSDNKNVIDAPAKKLKEKRTTISKEMNSFRAHAQIRQERTNQKWAGKRALKNAETENK